MKTCKSCRLFFDIPMLDDKHGKFYGCLHDDMTEGDGSAIRIYPDDPACPEWRTVEVFNRYGIPDGQLDFTELMEVAL